MAAFLATLSAVGAGNWEICKRHRLWGTGTSTHAKHAARKVEPGDELFVWQSGAGLLAHAQIENAANAVTDSSSIPWPDPARYSFTFQIAVDLELAEPASDRFKDHRSVRFGIRTHELQAGLIAISDDVAAALRSAFNGHVLDDVDQEVPTAVEPKETTVDDVASVGLDRDRRWARPMAGVYLRPASSVTEVLLTLYRRVADDEDGELLVVGDERDRVLVERELSLEPFVEMRGRLRFVTGDELAAELQRRFPRS